MNIRTKGQTGEREAARLLGNILGRSDLTRNLDQVRDGGVDILGIEGLCIEVKRHETLAIETWWRQVCLAADKQGLVPVLMWRQNRTPWRFAIPGYFLVPGAKGRLEMGHDTFASWLISWAS